MKPHWRTLAMIQFAPLLTMVAIISSHAYRRTSSYLPGAFINALLSAGTSWRARAPSPSVI